MTNNLPATISTLSQQIGDLSDKLKPVTKEHVIAAVKTMLSMGMALPGRMEIETMNDFYWVALEGVPTIGFQKAILGVVKGEYEISKGFMPTPPEFAAIARLEAKSIVEDIARLRLTKQTMEDNAPRGKDSPSPPGTPSWRESYKMFKENHEKSKKETVDFNALAADRQDGYWDRINALKDRPELTDDHLKLRAGIKKALEGETE